MSTEPRAVPARTESGDAERGLNRRQLMQGAGAAGIVIAGSGLLTACGSGSSSTGTGGGTGASTVPEVQAEGLGNPATPKRGGTLRIGVIGNGTGESFDPATQAAQINYLMVRAVFDPWIRPGLNGQTEPGLATEWTPNKDGSVWEVKLREGVTWHDGKPFTADDAIYTMRWMNNPANIYASSVANVRLAEVRKLDDHTIRVPLKSPNGRLFENFFATGLSMVQDGAKDFSKPIGTGPYRYESFTAGQRSAYTANRDYWDEGKPYPDRLEILSISDDNARLNALIGGQIDIATPITRAAAKAQLAAASGDWRVLVSAPQQTQVLGMRVDDGQFQDVRVRTAMKLIADREGLITSALDGFGGVANDLLGKGQPLYDNSLPQRQQDIEQAKSLLKAAGQEDMRVILHCAPIDNVQVPMATVFAQQAAAAGVKVQVKQEQPSAYFDPKQLFKKMPFFTALWANLPLQQIYTLGLMTDAPYNDTRWASASFDKTLTQAIADPNEQSAQELWNQLQKIQYDEGGYVAWGQQQTTDGYSTKVAGIGGKGSGWSFYPDDLKLENWGFAQ